jgi:electron transport complex protein RnfD
MLWPSARSRYVKEANMKIIYYSLLVLAVFMVLSNWYMYSFMHGMKLALMILVSVVVTFETEILFYSHDKDIPREEAKSLIAKSYPKITALIYVLLIPIGTPLWLVAVGAILATLLGKLLFGGYAHMVFHTSLVGVIFVTLGWTQLVDGAAFMTSFDNYLIDLVFNRPFFNDTLSLGNIFDPDALSRLEMMVTGSKYEFVRMFIGVTPKVIGSGLVLSIMFIFFLVKKTVNYITPVVSIASFIVTAVIIALANGYEMLFVLDHLFAGAFLYVVVFITTDPITTPIPTKGKIIFGIIVGALTMIIRVSGKYDEGVIFAVLFMNMLTPMLNEIFKAKKKVVKKAPKKEAV